MFAAGIVTIYYASDDELIEVPALVGWNVSTAKEKLESMQLSLNENYETQDSTKPKGEIISQNPAAGDKVIPGSRITVVVSSGVPETSTASISVELPSRGAAQTFTVYVNNETKINKSMLMDGSKYTFTVDGEGSNIPVKVYINGSEYCSYTVNFTTNPATVSNPIYNNSGSSYPSRTLPDVTGQNSVTAISTLNAAGFTNINTEYVVTSNTADVGKVLSQNPAGAASTSFIFGDTASYPTNTQITLRIGSLEGVGNNTTAAAD